MRRLGKSHAHPLIVLIALPNELQKTRIGVAAGRSIGNAIKRNRAKRVLREAMRPHIDGLVAGNDVLLLARRRILDSKRPEIDEAMKILIKRAGLDDKRDNEYSS